MTRCLLLDLTSVGKLTKAAKTPFVAVTITAYNLCVIGQEFTLERFRLGCSLQ